ncbi:YihY/virulence factor BrkB family protein [Aureimonas jatrophae]|uniref:Membrane protein n=1 Tax=Aureimonas jatrophae TaxID=1166073 RepID=A0A1H0KV60_9HYPH|nr:YihY/virulence factor BrkB family protein [Aureimonas jatrophae]MBB3948894.1 membrane protein [Aureimonas jatrophae]SDO59904.1 membrane protein [Aureimonas jatrophae]
MSSRFPRYDRNRTRPTQAGDIALGLVSAGGIALASFLAGRRRRGSDGDEEAAFGVQPARAPGIGEEPPSKDRPGDDRVSTAGRGRDARSPTEVPAAGWLDILWRTYEEFSRDRLMLVAAGVTFYVLLALFPAITALVSIYGLFTSRADIAEQVNSLSAFLPGGATAIIGEQMTRLSSQPDQKLGFGLLLGLGIALWSANAGMKTLFDAMNIVYEEEEKRSFVRLTLVTLGYTIGTLIVLILLLAAVVVLPVILKFLHLGSIESWLLWLRWPVLLLLVALALSVVYRNGPSRRAARWRWISPGAAVAALLWVAFSLLFSWYVQNFGSYDETYGSLGAAIGFMTWIWISTIVVLLGAELNAELEHQTARDTTHPPGRPMGARGARMADTLGKARG